MLHRFAVSYRMMRFGSVKTAMAVFILFLVGLVALADSGRAQGLFSAVETVPAGDKFGHFILFGILSFLTVLANKASTVRVLGLTFLKGPMIVMTLVTIEEFSQLFFRARTFDLMDLLSDALGIYFFGRVALAILDYRSRQPKPAVASVKARKTTPDSPSRPLR